VQKFVARQPILNRQRKLFAYELLFRSGTESFFVSHEPDVASSRVVVDSFLLFGIESLTGGRPAFINFTRNLITCEAATLLPSHRMFIEVLENITPDDEVVAACRALKDLGYALALDDFVPRPGWEPLVELADIIKVDFRSTPPAVQARLAEEYAPRGIRMLAEKVETHDEFHTALDLGYTYFQGFFFCKPETLAREDVPVLRHNHLHLLRVATQAEPDFAELESILKCDLSLCYRLMRFMNSAWFAFRTEISSVLHALTLLGVEEVRKWVSVVAMSVLAEDKPGAVLGHALCRARMHELIAPQAGMGRNTADLFLQGLFSCMDAVLDLPMSSVLKDLPLSEEVKMSLLGQDNRFRRIYDIVLSCEQAHWEEAVQRASAFGIDEAMLADDYILAAQWSEEIMSGGLPDSGSAEPAHAVRMLG